MVIFSFAADGLMWLVDMQKLEEIRSRQFTVVHPMGGLGAWPDRVQGQLYHSHPESPYLSYRELWSWVIRRGNVSPRRLMFVGGPVKATDNDVVEASIQWPAEGAGSSGQLPSAAGSHHPPLLVQL